MISLTPQWGALILRPSLCLTETVSPKGTFKNMASLTWKLTPTHLQALEVQSTPPPLRILVQEKAILVPTICPEV